MSATKTTTFSESPGRQLSDGIPWTLMDIRGCRHWGFRRSRFRTFGVLEIGSVGPGVRAACLPKVDKRGKYTMRARVAMPCTCAWQRHGRARGNAMGAFVAMPWACAWCIPLQSSLVPPWCQEITVSQDYCGYYTAQCCI